MIEMIDLQSPKAVGLRISGKIEGPDMEKVIEAVEDRFRQSGEVAIYVEMESFKGFSLDALVEDIKFAFPNLKKFKKKAVVSEREWVAKLSKLSDRLFPSIELRHFTPDRKEEAMDWVRE